LSSIGIDIPATPKLPDRSAWTIPLLCAGIGIIAMCLIVPAADDNRQLLYQREKLRADLAQIEKQVDVNNEFLKKLGDDPSLMERLAQRQMKMVRQGTSVLEIRGEASNDGVSPYTLLNLPPPMPLPAYRAVGGRFSDLCRQPHSRLMLLGLGLLLMAGGLMLDAAPSPSTLLNRSQY
jgi:hypothetical protein